MAWVEILPRYSSLFRQSSWESAAAFLGWGGILVNKHRHRQVEQVTLEPCAYASGSVGRFFLKKEFAVAWHDRFRNAWHGFGWCSTAVREAAMLQALREAGVGCPDVVALGEEGRSAFVLMRDESDMTELRTALLYATDEERRRLADALGRELARMHDAGFDHPDLFAKHILTARKGTTYRFCILDWQRARRRRVVPWRVRCRDLAVLDATLHEMLASDRLRLRCLRAYRRAVSDQQGMPPLGRVARQTRREAERLSTRRNIRETGQLPVPPRDQQFVPIHNGQLLIVRSYLDQSGGELPDWLTRISELDARASCGTEAIWSQSWPATSSAWEIPPLAHTLFRLQRFGVPAPRLLAVGCMDARIYLFAKTEVTVSLPQFFAKATVSLRARMLRRAGQLVRQMHAAGYSLPAGESWESRLGVVQVTGAVFLTSVESLVRSNKSWQELAPVELNHCKIRLSRIERLRFLQGYLEPRHGKVRHRAETDAHLLPAIVRERLAIP